MRETSLEKIHPDIIKGDLHQKSSRASEQPAELELVEKSDPL
jgi:hypothetical protein